MLGRRRRCAQKLSSVVLMEEKGARKLEVSGRGRE
jgi:hypothetical protein